MQKIFELLAGLTTRDPLALTAEDVRNLAREAFLPDHHRAALLLAARSLDVLELMAAREKVAS